MSMRKITEITEHPKNQRNIENISSVKGRLYKYYLNKQKDTMITTWNLLQPVLDNKLIKSP